VLEALITQQSKELLIGDEAGVAHLPEQRDVAAGIDHGAVFDVTQGVFPVRQNSPEIKRSPAPLGNESESSSRQMPALVRTQAPVFMSSMASC